MKTGTIFKLTPTQPILATDHPALAERLPAPASPVAWRSGDDAVGQGFIVSGA